MDHDVCDVDDVYNGMTPTLLNTLAKGEVATGHVLVFRPKPRLVKSTMRAVGEDPIIVGDARRTATRYLVDLEIVGIAGVFAKVAGPGVADRAVLAPLAEVAVARARRYLSTPVPACSVSVGAGGPDDAYASMI